MPDSRAQVRYAHAVLTGKDRKKNGMDKATAAEIASKVHGHKLSELPERKKPRHARRVR
jgi:hypothetical protein